MKDIIAKEIFYVFFELTGISFCIEKMMTNTKWKIFP